MHRHKTFLYMSIGILAFLVTWAGIRNAPPARETAQVYKTEPLDAEGMRDGTASWGIREVSDSVQTMLLGEYRHGALDGPLRQWYSDGTLLSSATFQDEALHGPSEVYYPDGSLKRRAVFSQGELNGLMELYSREAVLLQRVPFRRGKKNGQATTWYKSGQKRMEVQFEDDQAHGASPRWNEDGSPDQTLYFDKGEIIRIEKHD